MVTKSNKHNPSEKDEEKGRVKLRKLNFTKETVKDLSAEEKKQVKGGVRTRGDSVVAGTLYASCIP